VGARAPKPQSPIPNPHFPYKKYIIKILFLLLNKLFYK